MRQKKEAEILPGQILRKLIILAATIVILAFLFIFKVNRIYNIKLVFIIISLVLSVIIIILFFFKQKFSKGIIKAYYQIADFLFMLNMAFIAAQLFFVFIFFPTTVKQSSMFPTLREGNTVIIKNFKTPSRFDIIVLEVNSEYNNLEYLGGDLEENDLIVKRIIGMPGDIFYFKDGKLHINGEIHDEPYVRSWNASLYTEANPYEVPDDCYFVMGDNRELSVDSRVLGVFHKSQIIGVALYLVNGLFNWVRL